ncbi:hypothetical protein BDA96_03G296400 [Sorghum bicolor]|uniref:DUF4408 domain-containing protein n=1 Tax=Sorghum bicolor TaxID=4558 RepID=A0A921RGD7_SORBI|nr:uncharacterized protein LOC8059171 [Sorghum bicolor]KAG0539133.1 hypothetical protein BDA96_03G296400 [Sorghum bicolor]|eukprot:XP_002456238.1 uncharacterized protein LOC8059171 [Sorghum bicolor]
MDGADPAFAVSSSPWSSLVRGYFSPATLFLLLNMVIGTIALTSRSHRRRHGHRDDVDGGHHYQYQHQHRGHVHDQPQHHHHHHQYAPPPQLARTSSVMDRLRSLGLYRFRSGDFPPEYNHHLSAATEDSAAAAAAHSSSVMKQDQAQYTRSRSEPARSKRPPPARKNNDKKEDHAVVKNSTSVSEVKKLERAPAPRGLVVREEEDAAASVSVDARADDFINKFRQQLQLQRLNSLLNYKEMLNRGL